MTINKNAMTFWYVTFLLQALLPWEIIFDILGLWPLSHMTYLASNFWCQFNFTDWMPDGGVVVANFRIPADGWHLTFVLVFSRFYRCSIKIRRTWGRLTRFQMICFIIFSRLSVNKLLIHMSRLVCITLIFAGRF